MSLDCTSHQSIHVVTSRRRPAPPFAESGAVSDSSKEAKPSERPLVRIVWIYDPTSVYSLFFLYFGGFEFL